MINKTFTVEKANRFIAENKHLVNTQYKPEEHFQLRLVGSMIQMDLSIFVENTISFINSIHMIVFGGLCTGDMLKVRTW